MNSALCLCALGVLAVVAAAGIGVGLVVGSVGSFITSHDCLFHSNNKACACELVSWRRVREGEGKGTVERKKLHATKKTVLVCVCRIKTLTPQYKGIEWKKKEREREKDIRARKRQRRRRRPLNGLAR